MHGLTVFPSQTGKTSAIVKPTSRSETVDCNRRAAAGRTRFRPFLDDFPAFASRIAILMQRTPKTGCVRSWILLPEKKKLIVVAVVSILAYAAFRGVFFSDSSPHSFEVSHVLSAGKSWVLGQCMAGAGRARMLVAVGLRIWANVFTPWQRVPQATGP